MTVLKDRETDTEVGLLSSSTLGLASVGVWCWLIIWLHLFLSCAEQRYK